MLKWEAIEPKLGHWAGKFKPFFDTGQFDKIYDVLKADGKRGIEIAPLAKDTYAAFEKCPLYDLRCVFVGLAPYASFIGDTPISDGLAFSCSVFNQEQPSLRLIWDAVFNDLQMEGKRWTDLTVWAHQGVLLLNVALTAKKGKPESYVEIWEPFMHYLFEEVLGIETGLPIVMFGKEAQKMEKYTLPFGHYIKKVEHPAYSARMNREFKHENLFSWVNTILKEHNRQPIDWCPTQEDYDFIMDKGGLPF